MVMPLPVDQPTPILGGLAPGQFMRRHWQRRPLLVRGALPGLSAPIGRADLLRLATREGVEARLIQRDGSTAGWSLARSPLARRQFPPVRQPGWTVLVQGLERHVGAARELLDRFRFVPEARLDDLMVSWASDGGGVGPHFDSYDVFLIQVQGRRRWRYGRMDDARLARGVPLKIIENFRAEHDEVLEPGDLLYLPPMWAHDGVAVGECMTCSVGFRAPRRDELARELLLRMADALEPEDSPLYADAAQAATAAPGRLPAGLQRFAVQALRRTVAEPGAVGLALGEYLTEPKADVWFAPAASPPGRGQGVVLDASSRMLYDDTHVFLNGEAWAAAGRDAQQLRRLADRRALSAADLARCGRTLRAQIDEWLQSGWLQPGKDLP